MLEQNAPKFTRQVGDADPSLGLVAQSVLDEFPDCRVVTVIRDLDDCVISEYNATLADRSEEFELLTQDQIHKVCQETAKGLAHLFRSLPHNRKLSVLYSDLERPATIQAIWRFCLPNTPFPQERYEMLDNLRVTQIFHKVLRKYPGLPFLKLVKSQHFQEAKDERVLEKRTANA